MNVSQLTVKWNNVDDIKPVHDHCTCCEETQNWRPCQTPVIPTLSTASLPSPPTHSPTSANDDNVLMSTLHTQYHSVLWYCWSGDGITLPFSAVILLVGWWHPEYRRYSSSNAQCLPLGDVTDLLKWFGKTQNMQSQIVARDHQCKYHNQEIVLISS